MFIFWISFIFFLEAIIRFFKIVPPNAWSHLYSSLGSAKKMTNCFKWKSESQKWKNEQRHPQTNRMRIYIHSCAHIYHYFGEVVIFLGVATTYIVTWIWYITVGFEIPAQTQMGKVDATLFPLDGGAWPSDGSEHTNRGMCVDFHSAHPSKPSWSYPLRLVSYKH